MSLEDEIKLLDHSHKLEKKRLWLDKIIFVVIMSAVICVSKFLLEVYRIDQIREKKKK